MIKQFSSKIIEQIYIKYGYDAMRNVWIEELLELALILQQSKNKEVSNDLIIDEIADVKFCIEQMIFLNDKEAIDKRYQYKIDRARKRLL